MAEQPKNVPAKKKKKEEKDEQQVDLTKQLITKLESIQEMTMEIMQANRKFKEQEAFEKRKKEEDNKLN